MKPDQSNREATPPTRSWVVVAVVVGAVGLYLGSAAYRMLNRPVTDSGTQTVQPDTTTIENQSAAGEIPFAPVPSAERWEQPVPPQEKPVEVSPTSSPEEWKKLVQAQTDYLLQQSAQAADPDGVNQLTPAEIEAMRQKGVLAW